MFTSLRDVPLKLHKVPAISTRSGEWRRLSKQKIKLLRHFLEWEDSSMKTSTVCQYVRDFDFLTRLILSRDLLNITVQLACSRRSDSEGATRKDARRAAHPLPNPFAALHFARLFASLPTIPNAWNRLRYNININ